MSTSAHSRGLGVPDPSTAADRWAIQDLLFAYADGVDGRDWALTRSVFTDDAHLDYSGSGGPAGPRDEVVDWIATMLTPMGHTQHVLTNVRIVVDGTIAHAVSQLLNPLLIAHAPEPSTALFLGGRYVDRLRVVDGAWRIDRRVQAAQWQTTFEANALTGANEPRPQPGIVP